MVDAKQVQGTIVTYHITLINSYFEKLKKCVTDNNLHIDLVLMSLSRDFKDHSILKYGMPTNHL